MFCTDDAFIKSSYKPVLTQPFFRLSIFKTLTYLYLKSEFLTWRKLLKRCLNYYEMVETAFWKEVRDFFFKLLKLIEEQN